MRSLTSFLFFVLATPPFAQPVQYLSADGDLFDYRENEHGAVLTAAETGETPIIQGATEGKKAEIGDIIYLGRYCDVISDRFGDGNWLWAEAGFVVSFPDTQIIFPGQLIALDTEELCMM